ncbi:uncharacterized protein LOC131427939 [Malaya genurostris]|uniref:uncharacterized protein LOC131427939 n=1 Tax=Malaya genurostris TaxID=325434 RepID=UPI0026F3D241|nr:uncharacterized protein LOC131427939 [Malaya genurostris]
MHYDIFLRAETEDIYEEIDWESLDIVKLLRSLGVCKNVIKKFIDNGYDIELLKVIQRKEIETLVCEPYLADRTRIISGLNSWRISQNLPPISSPLKSSENVSSTHRSPMKSENCTASFLLNNSARGKRILKVYEETKVLSKTDRRNITHIVIDEYKDRFGKLTHKQLEDRAAELSKLFPSESTVFICYDLVFFMTI